MGSWFETCALSGLAIHDNDEIVLFILAGRGIGDGVYSTSFHRPMSLPIYGIYNDYGMIGEETNPEIAELLYAECVKMRTGSDRFGRAKLMISGVDDRKEDDDDDDKDPYKYDPEKKFENIHDMLNCIERGYLYQVRKYMSDNPEKHYMSQMLIHRKVYDAILAEWGNRIPYGDTVCVRDRIREFVINAKTTYKEVYARQLQQYGNDEDMREILRYELADDGKQRLARMLNGESYHSDLTYISEAYFVHDNDDLIDPIVNMLMTQYIFGGSRIAWQPTVGKGSQCSETMIHKVIWDSADAIIKAQHEEYGSDDDEDDEDENTKSVAPYTRETVWFR